MEYKDIEEHILNKIQNEDNIDFENDVKPLIEFYYKIYSKLTDAGFKLVHNLLVRNEPESFITELADYSILEKYDLNERNYIKAVFVLYTSHAELAIK